MTDTQKRNILILTADAGFGHRSAANAVAAALQRRHGENVVVNIVNPLDDPRALSVLRNAESDYDRLAREWPRFYEFGYKMSDLAMTTSVTETAYIVLMYDIISRVMKLHKPDAVVITFPTYQSTFEAFRRVTGNRTPMATIVTDLISLQRMWFHKSVDLCLVPTQVAADLAIERGIDPALVHVTGLPVNPALAEMPASKPEARAALGWQPDKLTLLAVGSKRVERLDEFLHVLNHAAFDIQIVAVAGGNEELFARLEATEWHVPAKIYNFVKNMPDFLHAADMVLSKAGGLIVTESLACGLPLLIMQIIPGQETGNAELVAAEGAGDVTLQPLALLETMAHWLKDDRRLFNERVENTHRLGKPQAAYEAADLIWQLAESGPAAPHGRSPINIDNLKELLRQFGTSG